MPGSDGRTAEPGAPRRRSPGPFTAVNRRSVAGGLVIASCAALLVALLVGSAGSGRGAAPPSAPTVAPIGATGTAATSGPPITAASTIAAAGAQPALPDHVIAPSTPGTVVVNPPPATAPTVSPSVPPVVADAGPPAVPATSTSTGSVGTTTTRTAAATTTTPTGVARVTGSDAVPGLTRRELRLAVVTDQPRAPGVRAWAAFVNGTGGILGRTVKLDVFDVGGDPQQYRSAVTAACTRDFAIVASTTSADDGGASAASCGIPNLPVRAASTADPAETTYAVFPARPGTELIGGISWLLRNVDGCCRGVAAVPNGPRRLDTAFRLAAASKVGYFAAGTVTVPTGAGAGAAYQRVVHVTSGEGAGLVWSMLDGTSTMALRRSFDATVFAPQVSWLCDEACYSGSFLADGGAAVEGQFVQIPIEPFEDATEIPGLRIYLQQSSQAGVLPSVQGAEMFAAGLLFEDAVTARAYQGRADPRLGPRGAGEHPRLRCRRNDRYDGRRRSPAERLLRPLARARREVRASGPECARDDVVWRRQPGDVDSVSPRRLARSSHWDEIERRGEQVASGITALRSSQSLWLVDRSTGRFQRCAPGSDPCHAVQFGRWRQLASITVEPSGDLLLTPAEVASVPIRVAMESSPARSTTAARI